MDVTHHKEMKKRGGQIPGFGNWDDVNELPITQYFECARQAGLGRYTYSGECEAYSNKTTTTASGEYKKKPRSTFPPSKQAKISQGKQTQGREGTRKQGPRKVFDVMATEQPHNTVNKKKQQQLQYRPPSKPVDEDLYKISPRLLHRKRRLGFFSRCLKPPCAV